MAVKAVNVKLDEERIHAIKSVASVFSMSMTDVLKEAIDEYIVKMQKDPFYRLTANVSNASQEETDEILETVESMRDDDLTITTVHRFTIAEENQAYEDV